MPRIDRQEYVEQIEPFIGKDVVKVLTGIRRCGKSTLLDTICQALINRGYSADSLVLHNFDSLKAHRFSDYTEAYAYFAGRANEIGGKTFFFFDEVQELLGWEKMVNSLMVDYDVDIYVTGSNSKLLSTEYATYLGGRYVTFNIYPLSFTEIKSHDPKATFEEYLEFGGMPFLQSIQDNSTGKEKYLQDIYDSIILKDITLRYEVRNVNLLRKICSFLIANVGHIFSATNVSNVLKNEGRGVSSETIYNFLDYCIGANLVHLVKRENVLGKDILRTGEKIYVTDHGLREAIYGNNFRDRDQVLENIVYLELKRRGYDVTVGKIQEHEIDFIAKKGKETVYFQVSWTIAEPATQKREMRSLLEVKDNFPKFIISTDKFDYSDQGIVHKNIEDWLLS